MKETKTVKRHSDGWNEQEGDYTQRMKGARKGRDIGEAGNLEYTGRVVVLSTAGEVELKWDPHTNQLFASPPHIASTLSLYEYKLDSIWFVRQTLDLFDTQKKRMLFSKLMTPLPI